MTELIKEIEKLKVMETCNGVTITPNECKAHFNVVNASICRGRYNFNYKDFLENYLGIDSNLSYILQRLNDLIVLAIEPSQTITITFTRGRMDELGLHRVLR